MAKKITALVKLQVKAQSATPSPPIGPALGQHSVNIMEFCKGFNARTQEHEKGMPLSVVITVYNDRSFTFIIKTPPASYMIMKAAGLQKGSNNAKATIVGKVKKSQLAEIVAVKMADLTASDMDAAIRTLAGSARSMGIEVVEG